MFVCGGRSFVGLVEEKGHTSDYQKHTQVFRHGVPLPQNSHTQDHDCDTRAIETETLQMEQK